MISIDFWDTLVNAETGGKDRRQARHNALKEIVGTLSSENIIEATDYAYKSFNHIWLNQQRTPSTEEMVTLILEYLGLEVTTKERCYLVTQFEESLLVAPPSLTEGAEDVLAELVRYDSLVIISDTMYSPGRIIREYLKYVGIYDYFKCFVFSDEIGFSKPNPKNFKKPLLITKSKAHESWHIGDLVDTDITGAKNIGMNAILFTERSGIRNDKELQIIPDYTCYNWQEIGEILTSNKVKYSD